MFKGTGELFFSLWRGRETQKNVQVLVLPGETPELCAWVTKEDAYVMEAKDFVLHS